MQPADHLLENAKRFYLAADYVRTNGFMTPALSFGIALALWRWFTPLQVFGWAGLVAATQLMMGMIAHVALRESDSLRRYDVWRPRLILAAFLSTIIFASAPFLFYVPGERLNNLLLTAVLVASIATLAAMTSPDRRLMVIMTTPLCIVLLCVMLIFEPYPFNLIFAGLSFLYVATTFVTSSKLSAMVGNLVNLQVRNDALIVTLAQEKREADAARIRAENASRAKSNFLANMSHELRTPMNAILGFSEIIKEQTFGTSSSERYASYAGHIHDSGRHLLSLINDILDLSRIEAGGMRLHDAQIDLAAMFRDVATMVAPQANARGVALIIESMPGVALMADRRAVNQILVNLAANAVKFTPSGGTVTIRQTLAATGGVVLAVEDTGVGIAEDDLVRVFEKFGQAKHEIATENEKGVGLGLPIAKGLAEAHGAQLTLRSIKGEGTSVTVVFPAGRTSRLHAAA